MLKRLVISFRLVFPCLLAMSLSLVSGCSKPGPNLGPTGTALIKVTYEGKPVLAGSVNFSNSQTGMGGAGILDSQGTCEIQAVPIGEYVVTVLPPPPNSPNPDPKLLDPKEIPKIFRAEDSTPLKTTIQEGRNEVNLELKQ